MKYVTVAVPSDWRDLWHLARMFPEWARQWVMGVDGPSRWSLTHMAWLRRTAVESGRNLKGPMAKAELKGKYWSVSGSGPVYVSLEAPKRG